MTNKVEKWSVLLKGLGSNVITVECESAAPTGFELKQSALSHCSSEVSASNLILTHNGFNITDNETVSCSSSIFPSIIDVGIKLRGGIQISIKTLSGRQQTFTFEPDARVIQVKEALQEKEGIQVDQIRLIYSGKQLADDKTLDYYKVQPGAVIHMVLQLRGGSSTSSRC